MDTSILNTWAQHLLDTGKRNSLVNFRKSKMGTAEIIAPDMISLFKKAELSAIFEVYDPKLDDDDEFEFSDEDDGQHASTDDGKLSKELYLAKYARKLSVKKNQVLVYNSENKPLQALKNIRKKGISAIEETGVNIVYIAFGFIHWSDPNVPSSPTMKAPILLAPVSIINDSPLEPFRLKIMDDELIVNPTFSYKMQEMFGIKLPEYDDDDENIESYFEVIKNLVGKLGWTISLDCVIGLFSFLKLNMHHDLNNNAEHIVSHPIVSTILNTPLLSEDGKAEIQPINNEVSVESAELFNVVDADSSQCEAIKMAKQGQNFVLQGPPGTGKSQTITNIIAELLHDGKTVLFVSEKLAALNVVFEKLKNVGLEDFCLELHSHKASKKLMIDELCETLRTEPSSVSTRANTEITEKQRAKNLLDEYATQLHATRPTVNKSLFEMISELSSCKDAPALDYAISNISSRDDYFINNAILTIDKFIECANHVGYNYKSCVWYGFLPKSVLYEENLALKTDISRAALLCQKLTEIFDEINTKLKVKYNDFDTADTLCRLFDYIASAIYITPSIFDCESLEDVIAKVTRLSQLSASIKERKAMLDSAFDSGIYSLDGSTSFKKLNVLFSSFFSRLFNKEYKQIINDLHIHKNDAKKPSYKIALKYYSILNSYQTDLKEYADIEADIKEYLTSKYVGIDSDFRAISGELEGLAPFFGLPILTPYSSLSLREFEASMMTFRNWSTRISEAFSESDDARNRLINLFNPDICDFETLSVSEFSDKCKGLLTNYSKLDYWLKTSEALDELTKIGIKDFIDVAYRASVPENMLIKVFKSVYYTQWIDYTMNTEAIFTELLRAPHDHAVDTFKIKDKLSFEINKAVIRAALSANRPSPDMIVPGSSAAVILREGEKSRKHKGIRQLLSEHTEFIQTLKPCFLMSPLSVSTFLDSDMVFDTVIFDEASQIFPWDAIGAIYRGKQLIVVGDSKQMPPSNFFNSVSEVDADSDDESVSDFESILDICAFKFPQRRLKWHYRSRYEQLISFSNKNFYQNDLVTFPSSKKDTRGIGVDYYYVDGVFDRTNKTNFAEAERVVDLVFESFEKHPERSVGVVAFSISQQNLIERRINKRRSEDTSKEEFFKSDRPEPFFIKNLETVQGDERDTIIFSVAYGYDVSRKLYHNFGPLNRNGGERRLNVAVTRAKHNVKLVASIHHTDIDLTRTSSVGAKLLKEYLDYAENGTVALNRTEHFNLFEYVEPELELEIASFLRENGYTVDTRVGYSSCKIDIGVKLAGSDNYSVCVECDGKTYREAKTTRDRDRLRQEVLERMGWHYYRIWASDWCKNKDDEKAKLLEFINATPTEDITDAPVDTEITETFEEELIDDGIVFPSYSMLNLDELTRALGFDKEKVIQVILEAEFPVHEEWVLRRTLPLFGTDKIKRTVRNEFNSLLDKIAADYGFMRKNGFVYFIGALIPMLRIPSEDASEKREINHIAHEELANGLLEIIKYNVSVDRMGLYRYVSRLLGFTRLTEQIIRHLDDALELIKDKIAVEGSTLTFIG